ALADHLAEPREDHEENRGEPGKGDPAARADVVEPQGSAGRQNEQADGADDRPARAVGDVVTSWGVLHGAQLKPLRFACLSSNPRRGGALGALTFRPRTTYTPTTPCPCARATPDPP